MKQFRSILYVDEASSASGAALARAVSLADNNQAELTVLGVVPFITAGVSMTPGVPVYTELQPAMVSKRRAELESMVAPHKQGGEIKVEVISGQMFLEVIRAVLRDQYDLVIKPARNPGFFERLFGSGDMQLLRLCPCPVWLTGPDEKATYGRILAAVDFNLDNMSGDTERSLNQQILELSTSIALSDFSELHFIHVWDAPAEMMLQSWADNPYEAGKAYVDSERSLHQRAFNRLRDQLRDQLGNETYDHIAPQFHLRRGIPSEVIPGVAKQMQADIVVMGTVARTGIPGFLIGNTAEDILEQLQCSVLTVKPHGFVTPVSISE